ncbi:hypothetical protein AC579_213 [Pseudocercospora musae]|uniref:Uncharacterized protein n=1 Tax=Pseudocercospora musae TaxID=113226 RepID=A0A139I7T8_9PEZI|nr:hypothetical protein AC579_213 [Pseudocercospora musae]
MHVLSIIATYMAISGTVAVAIPAKNTLLHERQSVWHGDPFNDDDQKGASKQFEEGAKAMNKRQSVWHGDPFNDDDQKGASKQCRTIVYKSEKASAYKRLVEQGAKAMNKRQSVWHGDPFNDDDRRGTALSKDPAVRSAFLEKSDKFGIAKDFAFYHGTEHDIE